MDKSFTSQSPMPELQMTQRQQREREYYDNRSPGFAMPVVVICLLAAVALQWLGGAYSSDFGGDPDEPGHFVSALMVRDFLLGGEFRHPVAFAKLFYLHYPKVAIGHWPPFLYAMLGSWMVAFGTSRAAALAFTAVAASATATVLYLVGRRRVGRVPALLAALVFLGSPLVQISSARVMSEHLVTLLALASALQFARYVRTVRMADALLFGVLAALAILTRGTAWALALVPPLTILLTRRFDLLRRVSLWLSALVVVVTCVPWYVLTIGDAATTWIGSSGAAPYWTIAAPFFARAIWLALGPVVMVAAALGIWAALIRHWAGRTVDPVWAALAALAVATFILHSTLPAGLDQRYMVAVLPEVALFTACGIAWLARLAATVWPNPAWGPALSLAVAVAFLAVTFIIPETRFAGYAAPARLLATRPNHTPPAFLVISDAKGEGAVVAEFALDQQRPGGFILRGSKLLNREDWLGREIEDRFRTPEELTRLLNEIPVSGILLDTSIPPAQQKPFQDRIRKLVTGNPELWERVESASVTREGQVFADAAQVYLRRPVPGSATQEVDKDLIRRLVLDFSNNGWDPHQ